MRLKIGVRPQLMANVVGKHDETTSKLIKIGRIFIADTSILQLQVHVTSLQLIELKKMPRDSAV